MNVKGRNLQFSTDFICKFAFLNSCIQTHLQTRILQLQSCKIAIESTIHLLICNYLFAIATSENGSDRSSEGMSQFDQNEN